MNGTSFSHTFEMDLMPPKMTSDTMMTMASPIPQVGMPGKFEVMMPVMELDCTAEPMPKDAMAANSANAPAPSIAHQGVLPFLVNARFQAYIAPPSILPSWSFTRYFTAANVSEYFVAMPNTPVSHIHSTAPGPPARMAVPTPTMLPVPMVADKAVVSAPNWLTSPGASGSFVTDSLMAVGILRWMNRVRNVRNKCDPNSSTIIGGPHTKASMSLIIWTMSMQISSLSLAMRHGAEASRAAATEHGKGPAPKRRSSLLRQPCDPGQTPSNESFRNGYFRTLKQSDYSDGKPYGSLTNAKFSANGCGPRGAGAVSKQRKACDGSYLLSSCGMGVSSASSRWPSYT